MNIHAAEFINANLVSKHLMGRSHEPLASVLLALHRSSRGLLLLVVIDH